MSSVLQNFVFDPALVLLAFSLAAGAAWLLSLAMTKLGGGFAAAVAPSKKLASLEGLRGILAFSVVVHHGCCWYYYSKTGVWSTGTSIIFGRLASFGVIQFFYISGYLFWRKLMRKGSIPLGSFCLSRFLRIGPVYYICVLAAILIGFLSTGFVLNQTPAQLVRSLIPLLLFCIGGQTSINGADTKRIMSAVAWTLALEWGFYLLLPLLGWFARRASRLIYYAITFGCIFLVSRYLSVHAHLPAVAAAFLGLRSLAKFMLIGFGGGILVAALEPQWKRAMRLSGSQSSWLVMVLYIAFLIVPGLNSWAEILLLIAFVPVIQGTDIFGLMKSRAIRLMGIISYDLYLTHEVVYYVVIQMGWRMRQMTPLVYIGLASLCIVIVVIVSTIMHLTVERPTMILSERIARKDAHLPSLAKPTAI